MSKHWIDECWRLALGVTVAVIAGLVIGQIGLIVALFLLGYCIWMIYRFHELESWLRDGGKKIAAPDTFGIASVILQLIYRDKKSSGKQKDRLRASLTQFNKMAAELPDATVVLDDNLQIRWCNSAATKLLGINRSRDVDQRIDNLIRNPEFHEFLRTADSKSELELQSPGNDQSTVALRLVPGSESMRILSGRDVTQRVLIREMRKAFVANVSHELRTPLTVIQGYLELLIEDDTLPGPTQKALHHVGEQSDRMGNIVNDLLTLSRLESSVLAATEGTPVDIQGTVDTILKELADTDTKGHVFITETDPALRVRGSATEVFSACQNLIHNAVRYTDSGTEITIGWKKLDSSSVFFVSDNGPGIEAHHLPRLSERFYRVDKDRSRDTGGTGLGLAIVKYIAQRHGATLNIQSEFGVGSTFEITFPEERTMLAPEQRPALNSA